MRSMNSVNVNSSENFFKRFLPAKAMPSFEKEMREIDSYYYYYLECTPPRFCCCIKNCGKFPSRGTYQGPMEHRPGRIPVGSSIQRPSRSGTDTNSRWHPVLKMSVGQQLNVSSKKQSQLASRFLFPVSSQA